jgi:hypothetical protein
LQALAARAAARAEAAASKEEAKVTARADAVKTKATAEAERARAKEKAQAEAVRIRASNIADLVRAREFSARSQHFYKYGKSRLSYHSKTIDYTRHPEVPFSQQLRDFLRTHGASTGVEIGRGILKNPRDHMFVTGEISVSLQRMEKSGVVTREKRKMGSYWSLVPGRESGKRLLLKRGGKIAQSLLQWTTMRAAKLIEDLRGDVISEVFLRLSTGTYTEAQAESVFDKCVAWVRKTHRSGLYTPEVSLDEPFGSGVAGHDNENLGTLLDVIANDQLDTDNLYKIEAQVARIQSMEGDGYTHEQVRHLYESSGTSWLQRAVV